MTSITNLFFNLVYVIFYGNWSSEQSQQDQNTFLNFVDNISTSPWFSFCKKLKKRNNPK